MIPCLTHLTQHAEPCFNTVKTDIFILWPRKLGAEATDAAFLSNRMENTTLYSISMRSSLFREPSIHNSPTVRRKRVTFTKDHRIKETFQRSFLLKTFTLYCLQPGIKTNHECNCQPYSGNITHLALVEIASLNLKLH